MTRFRTGHLEDSVPRHRPGHVYISGKFAVAQDSASMVRWQAPQLWQADLGMCFPMAVTDATCAQEKARGLPERLISPNFGYGVARAEAFRDLPREEQPRTLEDGGSEAGLLEDAYRRMGVAPWDTMPGPQDPRFDPSTANTIDERWQPAIDQAYDRKGLVVSEIDVSPSGRGDACIDLLNRLIEPIVVWYVDDAYMHNAGELVTSMGNAPPNHAQTCVQVDLDELLFRNWWRWGGIEWGQPDGSVRVRRRFFEGLPEYQVRIFAVTYLPGRL